jgi:hypothetical protein
VVNLKWANFQIGSSRDNTEINLNVGDQFAPSPSENEAAYWMKSS